MCSTMMSDSDIIIETPDISFNENMSTNEHGSNFEDVIDSSCVGTLDESVAESVIQGTKKTRIIRSIPSEDESDIEDPTGLTSSRIEPALESMNMSIDKSILQQSYRDMSIVVSSRSPSPDEILIIDSEDEDDTPIAIANSTMSELVVQNKHQVKLRPSILSPQVQQPSKENFDGHTVKIYTPFDIQRPPVGSQSWKQNEAAQSTLKNYVRPPGFLQPKQNIQGLSLDAIKSKVHTSMHQNENKIEVSGVQYQQQKEVIQRLNFDIIRARNMIRSMDLDKLPDKGDLLHKRLAKFLEDAKAEEQLLKNMVIVAGGVKPLKPVMWENLETGLTEVQPNTFGKKALQTLNFQKALTLDTLKELHGSLNTCPNESTYASDPDGLKVELMPHQKHALAWLKWRENQKPSGGILADDMGLGKTLTMISLILNCKEIEENTPPEDGLINGKHSGGTLVICPASLIFQWEAEIKKHVRRHLLSVILHHGTQREEKSKRLAKPDVVITTYSLAMRDHTKNGPLFNIKWRRIILDEAHQVRNYKSQTSLAVCALFAKSRWALTGTPVHNKELDLYALLKFLRCAPFDDLPVWKRWVANKATGGQDRLNTVLSSLILRRTKQQLSEKKLLTCLPEKEWQLVEVQLEKEEMQVYQKVLIFSRTLFAQFLHQRAEKDTDSVPESIANDNPNSEYFKMHKRLIKMNRVKPIKQHEILVLLLRLRQICCHASLITSMLQGEENAGDIEEEECEEMNILDQLNKLNIEEDREVENVADGISEDNRVGLAEASRNLLNPSHPIFSDSRKSSKIKKILEILESVLSKNEKVIIVSQWTKLLCLTAIQLKKSNIQYYQLDGSVPVPKRMDMVHNFNKESHTTKVLLLSLTAGGVGLNLVGANNLLLVDLHWNPQLEIQAQDRIYRVGQTKPVKIYKIITIDTIEQRIKHLQDKKLNLAEELLTGTKIQNLNKLTLDDLKMLFSM